MRAVSAGIVLLAALAALAACAKTPDRSAAEVPKRAPVVQVTGMSFPGGVNEAEAGSFTACKVDYYGMTCALASLPALLGVQPVVACVALDKSFLNADGFVDREHVDVRTVEPRDLRYHTVELELGKTSHDPDCIEAAAAAGDPQARILVPPKRLEGKDTVGHLAVALEQHGWVRISSKHFGNAYAHASEPYTVTLHRERATLSVADRSVVDERLAELQRRAEAEKVAQSAGTALAGQMRR